MAATSMMTPSMAPATELSFDLEFLCELLAPMWVEVCFVICFPIGLFLLRFDKLASLGGGGSGPRSRVGVGGKKALSPLRGPSGSTPPTATSKVEELRAKLEAEILAGNVSAAAAAWRATRAAAPLDARILRLASQALFATSQSTDSFCKELSAHLLATPFGASPSATSAAAAAVLEGAAFSIREPERLEEVHAALTASLGPGFGPGDSIDSLRAGPLTEALLCGLAALGGQDRASALCVDIEASSRRLSPRTLALLIKHALRAGHLDAALRHIGIMRRQGLQLPPFALAPLLGAAIERGRLAEVLGGEELGGLALPQEALVVALEDCAKRGDLELMTRIEASQRDALFGAGVAGDGCGDSSRRARPLPAPLLGALLKANAALGSPHALEIWEELVQACPRGVPEGLAVASVARCAESRFPRLAEEIFGHLRRSGMASVAAHSALMKVHASCGRPERACDLFQEMVEQKLEPDAAMYGAIIRFAAECGRFNLCRELFEKAPKAELHNIVSLFKALGRGKDAEGVARLLQKLKGKGEEHDAMIYNCALDALVTAGDFDRARMLAEEMRAVRAPDIVTYNTLLKGLCSKGDVHAATVLLREMEAAGVQPTDVSFNSIINAAVSVGDSRQAWRLIDQMERYGIRPDRFTLTIMLKALKHSNDAEVQRTFKLLDCSGVDVCSEEVLLNAVLETCVRHRETKRLASVLSACQRSPGFAPSVHSCASLIKAYSALQRPDRCTEIWRSMVQGRALEPNAVALGCMLDALVCAGRTDEAVVLFGEWKDRFEGATTIMYSTLIKGFAAAGRAKEAMEMWKEIKSSGVRMNVVVYNTLINAQVRAGAIEEAAQIFAGMELDGVVPDAITYSTLVKGHAISGDLDKAFSLFRRMRSLGLAKDSVVYNTLLDGCTRHNRMDLADVVIEDLERDGVPASNFTLGTLVKMYGKRRDLDKAFEAVERLPAQFGFVANTTALTCLMNACIGNSALPRALMVFERLKGLGETDSKALGVLLNGLVRAGCAEQALALVEEAYGLAGKAKLLPQGKHLLVENIEGVLRLLALRGKQEEARSLLQSLRAGGVAPSGRLLAASLLDGDGAEGGGDRRAPGVHAGTPPRYSRDASGGGSSCARSSGGLSPDRRLGSFGKQRQHRDRSDSGASGDSGGFGAGRRDPEGRW